MIFSPTTAASTTRTISPVTTIEASTLNTPLAMLETTSAASPASASAEPSAAVMSNDGTSPRAPSNTVASMGISMKPKVTMAATPTVAFGLWRTVLRAPPKMSPRVRGRNGTTPGWCTGGPQGENPGGAGPPTGGRCPVAPGGGAGK